VAALQWEMDVLDCIDSGGCKQVEVRAATIRRSATGAQTSCNTFNSENSQMCDIVGCGGVAE